MKVPDPYTLEDLLVEWTAAVVKLNEGGTLACKVLGGKWRVLVFLTEITHVVYR